MSERKQRVDKLGYAVTWIRDPFYIAAKDGLKYIEAAVLTLRLTDKDKIVADYLLRGIYKTLIAISNDIADHFIGDHHQKIIYKRSMKNCTDIFDYYLESRFPGDTYRPEGLEDEQ